MRPLRISDATSVLGLQQEIQRSEESRYDHRLHGVLLVAQGMTCPEVGRLLGDAPRSVEYWVHRYDQKGLAGIPPESKDPVVYHHPTRKSVGYFAAVRLRDGQFLFRRETGRFNGETFWEFLKAFQFASAVPGRRVLAISDNAQYHRSKLHLQWRDQHAPHFGLDFLPPYSPDLNPIERIWKLTRRLCLHNRYFGFLDGVVAAVEDQFAEWTQPNDTLRRLCAIT